jgi:ABC-type multidrug transport system fused ATPase/permease subunit
MSDEVEKKMKKVQKLINLKNLAPEKEQGIIKAPESWPSAGGLNFRKVVLRYRPTTERVLRSLDFEIKAGHKVGVVGRTGAGKSTLGLSLLRIIELESGLIEIDGVDISKVDLELLRRKVTTITQDPALFTGSLRFNIDPYGEESDETVDELLRKSGLDKLMKVQEGTSVRDFKITESGANLSAGEKQLVCLCRAALRRAKLVIFDEATANIDEMTEQHVMQMVKTEFAHSTVITIAHRLNTIINSDMVAVLSFGRLLEYGSPSSLAQKPDSEFAGLLKELQD